jgi:hypothetical protein
MCVLLTVPIMLFIAFIVIGLPMMILGGCIGARVAENEDGAGAGAIAAGILSLIVCLIFNESDWDAGQFLFACAVAGVLGGIIGGGIAKERGG